MSRVETSALVGAQIKTSKIRNFCILAHVDHGKTTLSDSLVSSNGIISAKLAGKLRFLDSTEEEQKRGITMKASALSLLFSLVDKKLSTDGISNEKDDYVINLIDCPGHIDFSSDVSTATRLCDGAIIVVDVLEGVCTQTHAVLFKALKERLQPCLVLNKIDRLLLEMRLTPVEAFQHLRRLVENINALAFTLVNSELMAQAGKQSESELKVGNEETATVYSNKECTVLREEEEVDEDPLIEHWRFSPDKGNIVFASAFDCWGFGVQKFVNVWSKKFGLNGAVLKKYIFEDYSFNPNTKKIVKCDPSDPNSQPMFASMVLGPIWQIYEAAILQSDPEKASKMAKKGLGIEITPREVNIRDPRITVQAILRSWLPVSDAVLRMVVRCIPSPLSAQETRFSTLFAGIEESLPTSILQQLTAENLPITSKALERLSTLTPNHRMVVSTIAQFSLAVQQCSQSDIDVSLSNTDDPLVVFVSKMVPVRSAEIAPRDLEMLKAQSRNIANAHEQSQRLGGSEGGDAPDVFMAIARVYSGVLRRNSSVYVLGTRHNPLEMLKSVSNESYDTHGHVPAELSGTAVLYPNNFCLGLYIPLGPSFLSVDTVPAGNLVGIVGLQPYLQKSATLASSWASLPLRPITFQAKPLLTVAIEPLDHRDLPRIAEGLKDLYQFDPVVEVGCDSSGQNTLSCLGELHLEQCVKALSERFARCQIRVSEPLIAFRESLAYPPLDSSILVGTSLTCSVPKNKGQHSSTAQSQREVELMRHKLQQQYLPPPWCDFPGYQGMNGGTARIVNTLGNLAITFRCYSLPPITVSRMGDFSEESSLRASSSKYGTESIIPLVNGFLTKYHTQRDDSKESLEWTAKINPRITDFLGTFYSSLLSETTVSMNSSHFIWDSVRSETENKKMQVFHSTDIKRIADLVLCAGPRSSASNVLVKNETLGIEIYQEQVPPRKISTVDNCLYQQPTHGQKATAAAAATAGKHLVVQEASVHRSESHDAHEFDSNSGEKNKPLGQISHKTHHHEFTKVWGRIHASICAGFLEAVTKGPLMNEALHGVCVAVEKVELSSSVCGNYLTPDELASIVDNPDGTIITSESVPSTSGMLMTGQLISDTRDGVHAAMLSSGSVRVVEPIYQCDLQCDQSQLGNLYSVLSKRRGVVTREDVIDGTSLFLLSVEIPIASSFGFAPELLKKTSGSGTAPQMQFSRWGTCDEDPFWKPQTVEELEEYGEGLSKVEQNLSRSFIDSVRKRKGLPVEEKIVASAEKQRTLSKKK